MAYAYPTSYRLAAVKRLRNRRADQTVLQVAQELGVHWTSLYKWDKQYPQTVVAYVSPSNNVKQAIQTRLDQVENKIKDAQETLKEACAEREKLTVALSVMS